MIERLYTQLKRVGRNLGKQNFVDDSRQIYPIIDVTDHESMLMHLEQSEFKLRRLVQPFKKIKL